MILLRLPGLETCGAASALALMVCFFKTGGPRATVSTWLAQRSIAK